MFIAALYIVAGLACFAIGYGACVAVSASMMKRTALHMTHAYVESNIALTQALMQVLVKLSEQPENVNPDDQTVKVHAIKVDAPLS